MKRMIAGIAAVLVLSASAVPASAGPSPAYASFAFRDKVPGLDRSWLDLLRQVFPDLGADDPGHAQGPVTKPVRIMPGDQEAGDDKHDVVFTGIDAARVAIGGKSRWVVMAEQDSFGLAPLMLFDAEGRLLDAVDVVADMHSSMDNAGPLPLGGGAAVVGIRNWHDNSSESFDDLKLVLIARDRFSLLHEGSASGRRKARLMVSEGMTFGLHPDPARRLARIEFVTERQVQRLAADETTKLGKPMITRRRVFLRWSPAQARYEVAGGEVPARSIR